MTERPKQITLHAGWKSKNVLALIVLIAVIFCFRWMFHFSWGKILAFTLLTIMPQLFCLCIQPKCRLNQQGVTLLSAGRRVKYLPWERIVAAGKFVDRDGQCKTFFCAEKKSELLHFLNAHEADKECLFSAGESSKRIKTENGELYIALSVYLWKKGKSENQKLILFPWKMKHMEQIAYFFDVSEIDISDERETSMVFNCEEKRL